MKHFTLGMRQIVTFLPNISRLTQQFLPTFPLYSYLKHLETQDQKVESQGMKQKCLIIFCFKMSYSIVQPGAEREGWTSKSG